MMTENDVVEAVCGELARRGWVIEGRSLTTEHGVDIVATRGSQTLHVEAKGEGSSKEGTARYGQVFTRNQVRSHIAVAVLTALQVVARGQARSAVAFPDNAHHRAVLGHAQEPLARLGVIVFWASLGSVIVEPGDAV
jgi:hypothetical protein